MTAATGALEALQQAQQAHDQVVATAAAAAGAQPWTAELVTRLTFTTLGFTLVVILVAGALLWRAQASAAQVLRALGILSILGFATLLLVVGYGNEQLTPIVGLFGAIAGYLLGRDARPPEADVTVQRARGSDEAPPRPEPRA